jgi:SAM-dependent methyltransferase
MHVTLTGLRPMSILQRIRNFRRGVLLKWGTAKAKRRIWNQEFSCGRWTCLEHTEGDCLYPILEKYCAGGDILDLGCGSGNTGNELNLNAYRHLSGVDISAEAVRQATERSRLNHRAQKNTYRQGDIEAFLPEQRFRVILFRESIYYIPLLKVKALLNRYQGFLEVDGVFITRFYDRNSSSGIIALIEKHFSLKERFADPDGRTMILVFR